MEGMCQHGGFRLHNSGVHVPMAGCCCFQTTTTFRTIYKRASSFLTLQFTANSGINSFSKVRRHNNIVQNSSKPK